LAKSSGAYSYITKIEKKIWGENIISKKKSKNKTTLGLKLQNFYFFGRENESIGVKWQVD
jgi:hypothetical protein